MYRLLLKSFESLISVLYAKSKSHFQEKLFQVHFNQTSVPIIQFTSFTILGILIVGGGFATIIYPPELHQYIYLWVSITCFLIFTYLFSITFTTWGQKNVHLACTLCFAVECIISGFYLSQFRSPHSAGMFLVYVFPFLSVSLPANFRRRLITTFISLLILPGMVYEIGFDISFFSIIVIVIIGLSLASITIGHMFYLALRRNFFHKRSLKLKKDSLKRARENIKNEKKRSEDLLLNILPSKVADKLQSEKDIIAEGYDDATVIFADIVNFTPLAANLHPSSVVRILDDIVSSLDQIIVDYPVEKIKTIGDEYFVTVGVPMEIENHAVIASELALAIRKEIQKYDHPLEDHFDVQIGLNTGPLVAGIIGNKKFAYDVWGDTVNVGSRMESQGIPGKIQVTKKTKNAIQRQSEKNLFRFEKRGIIKVKGKGNMVTYFLESDETT